MARQRELNQQVKCSIWPMAITIWLCGLCIGQLLINATGQLQESQPDGGQVASETDKYLNDYMTELASNLELPRGADLSEQIDALAMKLNNDLERKPELLNTISDGLRLDELVSMSTQDHNVRRKRSLALLLETPPTQASNSHIVHAKREADPAKILALANIELKQMGSFARKDCLRAAQELNSLARAEVAVSRGGAVRRSTNALARLVLAVANYGLALFDYVYASPEFFERIPILRSQVRALKERGEPLYRLIELVRHTTNYLKLMHAEPERPSTNVRVNSMALDGDDSQQVTSFNEIERELKMKELKKLISHAGIGAIKSIGRRLIAHTLTSALTQNTQVTQETGARVFYLIVASVLERKQQQQQQQQN